MLPMTLRRCLQSSTSALVLTTLLLTASLGVGGELDTDEAQFRAHLKAGEFGPARDLAGGVTDATVRDKWMNSVAQAQMTAGAPHGALRTAYGIGSDQSRSSAFEQLAGYRTDGAGAAGGAALADFDTLINLITTTVEPDSWDVIGGPGAVESFPTGVFVDAGGLMKRLTTDESGGGLTAIRESAARDSGNRDLDAFSSLRKVSLNRLEKHAQMLWAIGRKPSEAMQSLAGIYDVKYVLFYPETRDIVLAGPASGWRVDSAGRRISDHAGAPVVLLDDLIVVMRNAFSDSGSFGCAITPSRERLAAVQTFLKESSKNPLSRGQRAAWLQDLRHELGPQDITVFGIDPATHAGRVLVEADYHMKLVGMGLAEGTLGVQSYLDSVTLDADGQPPAMDVLRWWFTLNYTAIRTNASHDGFELVGPGVQVQSENELLDARGGRIHTGKSDELNHLFAHSFTKQFDELAIKYPIYAELRNVFDLALAAQLIRSEGLADQVDWQMMHFKDPMRYLVATAPAPTSVESIINHRLLSRKHLIVGVSGGVRFDATTLLKADRVADDSNHTLRSVHARRTPSDVSDDAWWWD